MGGEMGEWHINNWRMAHISGICITITVWPMGTFIECIYIGPSTCGHIGLLEFAD
jgi:hypothetical protein